MTNIDDTVNAIITAGQAARAWDLLRQYTSTTYGLDYANHTTVVGAKENSSAVDVHMHASMDRQWLDRYAEMGYASVDPGLQNSLKSLSAYFFDIIGLSGGPSNTRITQMAAEATEFGILGGVSFRTTPLGPSVACGVAFSGPVLVSELLKQEQSLEADLRALCDALQIQLERSAIQSIVPQQELTMREKETLRLSAMGLAPKTIADKQDVGIDEIRRRMKSAKSKLGARTHLQAVAHALWLGEISV